MFRWFLQLMILFLIFNTGPVFSEYPEIKKLTHADPLYKQLQEDISAYYRAASSPGRIPFPALKIFRFSPVKASVPQATSASFSPFSDLFSFCARINVPYDTIATLNHISNPGSFKNIHTILIPNIPGLFVPENPGSDLEQIMLSWRMQSLETSGKIVIQQQNKKENHIFFIGERFHPVERAYFLNLMFRFPLPRGRITSAFGKRASPFTGHKEVHNGIDIGAKDGTDVYAARDGIVKKNGFDKIYGNYVLIDHEGGYQSFYGHLKDFNIHLNMIVYSGMVIGRVGTTGRSTGPHLHFEIRKNGSPKDPYPFLQRIE